MCPGESTCRCDAKSATTYIHILSEIEALKNHVLSQPGKSRLENSTVIRKEEFHQHNFFTGLCSSVSQDAEAACRNTHLEVSACGVVF